MSTPLAHQAPSDLLFSDDVTLGGFQQLSPSAILDLPELTYPRGPSEGILPSAQTCASNAPRASSAWDEQAAGTAPSGAGLATTGQGYVRLNPILEYFDHEGIRYYWACPSSQRVEDGRLRSSSHIPLEEAQLLLLATYPPLRTQAHVLIRMGMAFLELVRDYHPVPCIVGQARYDSSVRVHLMYGIDRQLHEGLLGNFESERLQRGWHRPLSPEVEPSSGQESESDLTDAPQSDDFAGSIADDPATQDQRRTLNGTPRRASRSLSRDRQTAKRPRTGADRHLNENILGTLVSPGRAPSAQTVSTTLRQSQEPAQGPAEVGPGEAPNPSTNGLLFGKVSLHPLENEPGDHADSQSQLSVQRYIDYFSRFGWRDRELDSAPARALKALTSEQRKTLADMDRFFANPQLVDLLSQIQKDCEMLPSELRRAVSEWSGGGGRETSPAIDQTIAKGSEAVSDVAAGEQTSLGPSRHEATSKPAALAGEASSPPPSLPRPISPGSGGKTLGRTTVFQRVTFTAFSEQKPQGDWHVFRSSASKLVGRKRWHSIIAGLQEQNLLALKETIGEHSLTPLLKDGLLPLKVCLLMGPTLNSKPSVMGVVATKGFVNAVDLALTQTRKGSWAVQRGKHIGADV